MYGSRFLGYLLKFNKTNTVFPNKNIEADSFRATPLQRSEIKAYRDSNNKLHRITSSNHKTKLVFTVMGDDGSIPLSEMREILDMLKKAYSNYTQRKMAVTYWDDETLSYRTMTAYVPDITYTKEKVSDSNIMYKPFEVTMIEY